MTREEILSIEEYCAEHNIFTIELQTRTGTAIRIQGVMTPAHLRELIAAGNV